MKNWHIVVWFLVVLPVWLVMCLLVGISSVIGKIVGDKE